MQTSIATFDVLTRVGLPILTFALGSLATYLLQRHWRGRDLASDSARALADLVADWYNQLHTLEQALKATGDASAQAALVDAYVRNRLILPKVLFHLTVLQEREQEPELTDAVTRFLDIVTARRAELDDAGVRCRDPVADAFFAHGRLLGEQRDGRQRLTAALEELDAVQQRVTREAARVRAASSRLRTPAA